MRSPRFNSPWAGLGEKDSTILNAAWVAEHHPKRVKATGVRHACEAGIHRDVAA